MGKQKIPDEAVFCAKYLKERGFLSGENLEEITALIDDLDVSFEFVKVKLSFYVELAKAMRELWPAGEKDGKYPWRDSVANLSRRLESLWVARNLGEYSLDTCLMVAKRYLAQYSDNTKYMQTLPYFILKQGKIMQEDGHFKLIQKSVFADMLESVTDEDKKQAEWEAMFESSDTVNQGGILI